MLALYNVDVILIQSILILLIKWSRERRLLTFKKKKCNEFIIENKVTFLRIIIIRRKATLLIYLSVP